MTVTQLMLNIPECYGDGTWVSEAQCLKALETNQLWTLRWNPETTVGFEILNAADLEVLLEHVQRCQ